MATLYIIAIYLIQAATAQSFRYTRGAVVGGSVQLPCYIPDGNGYMEWLVMAKHDDAYSVVVEDNAFTSNYKDNRRYVSLSYNYINLTITNIADEDVGVYQCQNLNLNSAAFDLIIVNPQVVDFNLSVHVGDFVNLECPFSAANEWSIYKGGNTLVPFHNSTHLSIWNVSLSDSGIYYCFKNKQSYSINVSVEFVPTTTAAHTTAAYTTAEATTMQFIIDVNVYHTIIATLAIIILLLLMLTIILIFMLCRRKPHTALPTSD